MSKKAIQKTTLTNIADAIRAKTGDTALMTPAEMITKIGSIGGAFEPDFTPWQVKSPFELTADFEDEANRKMVMALYGQQVYGGAEPYWSSNKPSKLDMTGLDCSRMKYLPFLWEIFTQDSSVRGFRPTADTFTDGIIWPENMVFTRLTSSVNYFFYMSALYNRPNEEQVDFIKKFKSSTSKVNFTFAAAVESMVTEEELANIKTYANVYFQ